MLIALLGLVFWGCKGPQGEIGPEGPQGVQGVPGPKGDPGTAGSLQFSVGQTATEDDGFLGLTLKLTAETRNSVEKGVILVYAKSQNFWFPLPGIVLFANNQIANYSFFYGIENLDLQLVLLPLGGEAAAVKRSFQDVRIVVVPAMNGRLPADLDLRDYDQVRRVFQLPE
jgi:hypothetical protein